MQVAASSLNLIRTLQRKIDHSTPSPTCSGDPGSLSRRTLLGVLAAGAFSGCQPESSSQTEGVSGGASRTDVPLRITLVGHENEAQAIRSAWTRHSEQPLEITLVHVDATAITEPAAEPASASGQRQADLRQTLERWQQRALRSDILVVPQSLIGTLTAADAIVGFQDDVLEDHRKAYGALFAAVENELGKYGSERWASPAGAKTFALLTIDPDAVAADWAAYDQLVVSADGEAAEPLAAGWAAACYLHRCATTIDRGWLFNRVRLEPEIDNADYVAVLEQLVETAKRYRATDLTPSDIWKQMRGGRIKVAIGYETPATSAATAEEDAEIFDINVSTGPVETQIDRLWFPPSTPLACISSGCRQTDASKQMTGWLSGADSAASLWRQTDRFSQTRQSLQQETSEMRGAYPRWLAERLSTLQAVPSLTLPGGWWYYEALDENVRQCLAGTLTAADAMAMTKQRWQAITDQLGRQNQMVAWKRVLGFGG